MKKLLLIIGTLATLTMSLSAMASIHVGAIPQVAYNNTDYVGKIVAAEYGISNGQPTLLILTEKDQKNKDNQIPGLTLVVDGTDLSYGMALASSVGKKIAVTFENANYDISYVNIITDEYYYGGHRIIHR